MDYLCLPKYPDLFVNSQNFFFEFFSLLIIISLLNLYKYFFGDMLGEKRCKDICRL